jgi:hypothetical protein
MFPKGADSGYFLCFRLQDASKESADRYKCRYLTISGTEAAKIGSQDSLPEETLQRLDSELRGLNNRT